MGGLDAMKVLTTFLLFATTLPAFGNSFDVYAVQFDQPAIVYLDPNGNTILHESYPLNPILGFTPILTFGFIQPLGSTFTWTISLTLAGRRTPRNLGRIPVIPKLRLVQMAVAGTHLSSHPSQV